MSLERFLRKPYSRVGLPESVVVDRRSGQAALSQYLGKPLEVPPDDWAEIIALASDMRIYPGLWVRFELPDGVEADWHLTDLEQDDPGSLSCCSCATVICQHIAAIALLAVCTTDSGRVLVEQDSWRHLLAPLSEVPAAPKEDTRGGGHIRAVLASGEDRRGGLWEGDLCNQVLRLDLVPYARRGNRPLKPRPAPKSLSAIERKVATLSDGDRRICRLAEQRRLLARMSQYKYSGSTTVVDELNRLDLDLMVALADVTELVCAELPVTVDAQPWKPTMRVADDTDHGGLDLSWLDPPLAVFEVADGYVLDAERRLRPVDSTLPSSTLALLRYPLPTVSAGQVEAFRSQFMMNALIPLEVQTGRVNVEAVAVVHRLYLRDEGGLLHLSLAHSYGGREVPHGAPGTMVQFGEQLHERLARRDLFAEDQALKRLKDLSGDGRWPPRLRGHDAYDFLLDGVSQLDGWEIYLDKTLRERGPVGVALPEVSFSSGVDWFDIEVVFEAEGRRIPASAVLKSWQAGQRYVILSDGSAARLPRAWLARHGGAAAELLELRKAGGGRLGAFAAPVALDLLEEAVRTERLAEWQDLAERLRRFDTVPERALPRGIKATLRDYQHRGYRWMAALRDLGLGAILADDMGLGKTLQALVLLRDTHRRRGSRSLVVAPTSVIHNWVSEAKRFVPDLRVHLHYGSKRGPLPTPAQTDLVITSYALMRLDIEQLSAESWQYVVLDEAQNIKNPASLVARAARRLPAKHRLALTGTPLENHLMELWSIFEFLMPGFFGSQKAFKGRYVSAIQKDQKAEAMGALRRRLRPFVLRRFKHEVATELPPRQEQILRCELGPAQRRLYEQVKESYRDSVLNKVESDGVGRSTIQILEALMRLRQVCCDPRLIPFPEARAVRESAKMALLMRTLGEAIEEGHRSLVFSQWPSLLKLVIKDLDRLGIDYLYLDGSTRDRASLQNRWNDDAGPPVFLISLKAGGTGLNLIGADTVFHLDPWWNPAVEQQATDRAHRIGQTKPVMVYKLVAADTVEEKILELQDRKRQLAEAALDEGRVTVDALTQADLAEVFAPGGPTPAVSLVSDLAPASTIPAAQITRMDYSQPDALPEPVSRHFGVAEWLDNKGLRDLMDWKQPLASKRLKQWTGAGLIERVGTGRGTRYRLA